MRGALLVLLGVSLAGNEAPKKTGAQALPRRSAAVRKIKTLQPTNSSHDDRFPRSTLSVIRFEGSGPRLGENVGRKLLSQVGQPLDQRKLEADLKMLMWTRFYSSVSYYLEEVPPRSGEFTLTFEVRAKRD
jgi:hypothetical protein